MYSDVNPSISKAKDYLEDAIERTFNISVSEGKSLNIPASIWHMLVTLFTNAIVLGAELTKDGYLFNSDLIDPSWLTWASTGLFRVKQVDDGNKVLFEYPSYLIVDMQKNR